MKLNVINMNNLDFLRDVIVVAVLCLPRKFGEVANRMLYIWDVLVNFLLPLHVVFLTVSSCKVMSS